MDAAAALFAAKGFDAVGMDGFNTIWTSPETLPTRAETTDPQVWLDRVIG